MQTPAAVVAVAAAAGVAHRQRVAQEWPVLVVVFLRVPGNPAFSHRCLRVHPLRRTTDWATLVPLRTGYLREY